MEICFLQKHKFFGQKVSKTKNLQDKKIPKMKNLYDPPGLS